MRHYWVALKEVVLFVILEQWDCKPAVFSISLFLGNVLWLLFLPMQLVSIETSIKSQIIKYVVEKALNDNGLLISLYKIHCKTQILKIFFILKPNLLFNTIFFSKILNISLCFSFTTFIHCNNKLYNLVFTKKLWTFNLTLYDNQNRADLLVYLKLFVTSFLNNITDSISFHFLKIFSFLAQCQNMNRRIHFHK